VLALLKLDLIMVRNLTQHGNPLHIVFLKSKIFLLVIVTYGLAVKHQVIMNFN